MVEDGKLVHRNNPVPREVDPAIPTWGDWMPQVFGHSYLINRVLQMISLDEWTNLQGSIHLRVANDPVDVTCRLLDRLVGKVKSKGVRLILVMQHGAGKILSFDARTAHARSVIDCARALSIQLVDEYDSLKAIARRDKDGLKPFYVMSENDTAYGHMSSQGNLHVARMIEQAIQEPGLDVPPPKD